MLGHKIDYEEERLQRKALELTERAYDTYAVHIITGEKQKVWRLQCLMPKSGIDSIRERYTSQGLEVFVGDFVSDGRGIQQESRVAIFTLDPKIKIMYIEIPCPDRSQVLRDTTRDEENPALTRKLLGRKYAKKITIHA